MNFIYFSQFNHFLLNFFLSFDVVFQSFLFIKYVVDFILILDYFTIEYLTIFNKIKFFIFQQLDVLLVLLIYSYLNYIKIHHLQFFILFFYK